MFNVKNIVSYVTVALAIIIVTTVTEFIKAYVSYTLGDRNVKENGYLTLNPIKHFEPIGFVLMFLTGFGWANPVKTNAYFYKDRKKGTILTYLIPIVFNIVIGILLDLFIKFTPDFNTYIFSFLSILSAFFIKYGIFNLIPVYPLCGYRLLLSFFSPNSAIKFSQYEKIMQIILLFGIFFGLVGTIVNTIYSVITFIL